MRREGDTHAKEKIGSTPKYIPTYISYHIHTHAYEIGTPATSLHAILLLRAGVGLITHLYFQQKFPDGSLNVVGACSKIIAQMVVEKSEKQLKRFTTYARPRASKRKVSPSQSIPYASNDRFLSPFGRWTLLNS